jgi:hypothetical protein
MKTLPVGKYGQHGVTIVDDEDADIAGDRSLSLLRNGKGYCFIQHYYSKGKHAQLHRLIAERMLGRPLIKGEVVDHIDGDTLNNKRSNLRVVTQRQNTQNYASHRNGRLVGCHFYKRSKKWRAYIKIHGKPIHLGYFPTEEAAHQAYLAALATNNETFVEAV